MSIEFGQAEKYLLSLFRQGEIVSIKKKLYRIKFAGKPRSQKRGGEPKTDIYVCLKGIEDNEIYELKLSYKKSNAEFLENKMKPERAEQIFGQAWKNIINRNSNAIYEKFNNRKLIFKGKYGRTQRGSITLGWRFELSNKGSGELSNIIEMAFDQKIEVYSGNKLTPEKKNALISGVIVKNSGSATSILFGDISSTESSQNIVDRIIPMGEYVKKNPDIYAVYKALNYNTFKEDREGNRNLAVYVNWEVINGKLTPKLEFSNPLEVTGEQALDKLKWCMKKLNIKNTDDINSLNSYI